MNRAKTFFTSVSLAVLLLFGLTAPAHAITTLTSSLLSIGAGQFIVCPITNVGPHPITVTIEIVDRHGVVVSTQNPTSVPPATAALGGAIGPLDVYCKFTGNFNRGFVRANPQIQDNNTTISVVPAQAVGE